MLVCMYFPIFPTYSKQQNHKHSINPSLLRLASIDAFSMVERDSTLPVSQNSDAMQDVCDWCTFKLSNSPETICGAADIDTLQAWLGNAKKMDKIYPIC